MSDIKKVIKDFLPEWIIKHIRVIRLIPQKLKHRVNLFSAINATIINANEAGEVIKTIKEESVETISLAKVYDFVVRGEIDFVTPKLDLMKYSNAVIFAASDFILFDNKAVWDKFYKPQFTKIVPMDQDLLKRKTNEIFIKKPRKIVNVKVGFSLCGVHSAAWTHFVVQYLPKLYLIPEIAKLSNEKVTIVLPKYFDPQLHELVYEYLAKMNGINILELNEGEAARCNILYQVDNTAWLSECIRDISPSDGIIPKYVAESIKSNLLASHTIIGKEGKKIEDNIHEKLFIARGNIRNIVNYEEVKKYFIQKGYHVIEPHMYTLREKIDLFRTASLIVGPLSGGFTNLFYCMPGTKVMILSNYQRCFDTYLGFLNNNFDIDITVIAGLDENKNDINSSFYIPLDKIKSACDELGY